MRFFFHSEIVIDGEKADVLLCVCVVFCSRDVYLMFMYSHKCVFWYSCSYMFLHTSMDIHIYTCKHICIFQILPVYGFRC